MTNHFKAHDSRIGCILAFSIAALCARTANAIAQETGTSGGQQPPSTVSEEQVNVNAVAEPGRLMRAFSWAETQIDNHLGARDGWYPELGGMIPGAGVSAGPGYRHHLFGDQAVLDASAAISWNGYRMMRSQLTWPRLMNDRLLIGGQVKYQDFTQINFFGIGNTTLKSDQTDYRLKDVDALGFVFRSKQARAAFTRRPTRRSARSPHQVSPSNPTMSTLTSRWTSTHATFQGIPPVVDATVCRSPCFTIRTSPATASRERTPRPHSTYLWVVRSSRCADV